MALIPEVYSDVKVISVESSPLSLPSKRLKSENNELISALLALVNLEKFNLLNKMDRYLARKN